MKITFFISYGPYNPYNVITGRFKNKAKYLIPCFPCILTLKIPHIEPSFIIFYLSHFIPPHML